MPQKGDDIIVYVPPAVCTYSNGLPHPGLFALDEDRLYLSLHQEYFGSSNPVPDIFHLGRERSELCRIAIFNENVLDAAFALRSGEKHSIQHKDEQNRNENVSTPLHVCLQNPNLAEFMYWGVKKEHTNRDA